MKNYDSQLTHLNWAMESPVQIGDALCTDWAECAKVTHIQDLTKYTQILHIYNCLWIIH